MSLGILQLEVRFSRRPVPVFYLGIHADNLHKQSCSPCQVWLIYLIISKADDIIPHRIDLSYTEKFRI